ncbi:MAG TPA: TRAFs-binding domain-containing protein [Rhizomicrobium sp.]|jgi:tetratricopeptide (TPR) repeat protein
MISGATDNILLSIVAHARSGALDRADRLFFEGGLDKVKDDPAVLSVKGRLLKDHALAASVRKRKSLYREAAEAYEQAAKISGTSYPLINAATLSLLAGQRRRAGTFARRILSRAGTEETETLYWRAATLAEAQLLLGRTSEAKASLRTAIALAVRSYEDHASTLRQFGLILDELGADKTWLDEFRPPRSLHFAGHMALSPTRNAVERVIRKTIEQERIGFGYGALAAGADILVAEALLEAGAELHLVLPATTAVFRDMSVASLGADWATRFDAIIKRASNIRVIKNDADPISALEIKLAAEIAMGNAVMQAEILMTEAVQLVITDRTSGKRFAESATGANALVWRQSARRQYILTAPRVRRRALPATQKRPEKEERLAAFLRIDLSGTSATILLERILPRLAEIFAATRPQFVPPRWTGEALIAVFQSAADAAEISLLVARALKGHEGFRIAAHFGIARLADDPFSAQQFVVGPAALMPARILLSTPAGAVHASEDFAAVLCAGPANKRPRVEYIGDLPSENSGSRPVRLFSLKP